MKQRIVLQSEKKKDKLLICMKDNSKPYNLLNLFLSKTEILFKERNGIIKIYIPWGSAYKEFQGSILEREGKTYIEGEFKILRSILVYHSLLWGIVFGVLIYLLCAVSDIRVLDNAYCYVLLGAIMFIFVFDIWFLFLYLNKKYIAKILHFLEKCI